MNTATMNFENAYAFTGVDVMKAAQDASVKLSKFSDNVLKIVTGVGSTAIAAAKKQQNIIGEAVKSTFTETTKGILETGTKIVAGCSAFTGLKCTVGGVVSSGLAMLATIPAMPVIAPGVVATAVAAAGTAVLGVVAATVVGLAGNQLETLQHNKMQTIAAKADAEHGAQLVAKGKKVSKPQDVADVGAYINQNAATVMQARETQERTAMMAELGFEQNGAKAIAAKMALQEQMSVAQGRLAMAVALVGTPEVKAHYKPLLDIKVQKAETQPAAAEPVSAYAMTRPVSYKASYTPAALQNG